MIRPFFPRPWQLRAALDGMLTAVAVLLDPQPRAGWLYQGENVFGQHLFYPPDDVDPEAEYEHWDGLIDPAFSPGDLLVVKEAYTIVPTSAYRASEGVQQTINPHYRHTAAIYKAGWDRSIPQWKSPVTMPRWASRMTWEVESVRACRVRDVTEEEMRAYGIRGNASGPWGCEGLVEDFVDRWETDHGPDSWERSPWIGFYRINVHLCNVKEIAA